MRRRSGRGNYKRATIHAILDEGMVGHVGVVGDDGQPFVIPVLYARDGDRVYLHGSPLSRLLSTLADGVRMCLTVTLMDGLVLARSAFHHSMNYRSVVILGEGRPVQDPARKHQALRALVEHIVAGPLRRRSRPQPQGAQGDRGDRARRSTRPRRRSGPGRRSMPARTWACPCGRASCRSR